MALKPRLNMVCGRCGKPRGLRHVCVSNSRRKATIRTQLSWGKCPRCRKPYGNPLTHECAPKSDFKQRRAAYEKRQREAAKAKARAEREAARKQQPKHDYTFCRDKECPKPLCKAFKTGYQLGDQDGYERGWEAGVTAGLNSAAASQA